MRREDLLAMGVAEELIDKIMAEHGKAVNAEKAKVDKYKTDAEKAEELAKELEALKSQNLSETEKVQKELEKAQQMIAELTKNSVVSELKAIFGEGGLKEDDYKEYIDAFAGLEKETAKAKATALVNQFKTFKETTEKQIREQLLDETKGGGGGGNTPPEMSDAEKIAKARAEARVNSNKASNDVLAEYGIGNN